MAVSSEVLPAGTRKRMLPETGTQSVDLVAARAKRAVMALPRCGPIQKTGDNLARFIVLQTEAPASGDGIGKRRLAALGPTG